MISHSFANERYFTKYILFVAGDRMNTAISNSSDREGTQQKYSEDQIRQYLHEIKIFIQKYSKREVGKGSDEIKTNYCEDMIIFRGHGFLTEPEKYIAQTSSGRKMIRVSRMEALKRFSVYFLNILESKFKAKVIYDFYDIKPEKDFWIRVVVFDRNLI